MGKSEDLLRMLEPAVRPGNLPAPVRSPQLPIEERSFDSLLMEAREASLGFSQATAQASVGGGSGGGPHPTSPASGGGERNSGGSGGGVSGGDASLGLKALQGVDRIESTSLRGLMARLPSGS